MLLGDTVSPAEFSLFTGLLGTDPDHFLPSQLLSSLASLALVALEKSKDGLSVTFGEGMLLKAPPVG